MNKQKVKSQTSKWTDRVFYMQEFFCSKHYSRCPKKYLKIFAGFFYLAGIVDCIRYIASSNICFIASYKMLKCLFIEIFDSFFIGQYERPLITKKKTLLFVNICFCCSGISFQSLRNLENKCEEIIEHFVPL